AYLFLEYYYNVSLLDFISQPVIVEEQAREIEQSGHMLAAMGLTLLLAPALALFIHRIIKNNGFTRPLRLTLFATLTAVGVSATFATAYHAQARLMNMVVASSDDQMRFNAYYLSIIRSLLVEGSV